MTCFFSSFEPLSKATTATHYFFSKAQIDNHPKPLGQAFGSTTTHHRSTTSCRAGGSVDHWFRWLVPGFGKRKKDEDMKNFCFVGLFFMTKSQSANFKLQGVSHVVYCFSVCVLWCLWQSELLWKAVLRDLILQEVHSHCHAARLILR